MEAIFQLVGQVVHDVGAPVLHGVAAVTRHLSKLIHRANLAVLKAGGKTRVPGA